MKGFLKMRYVALLLIALTVVPQIPVAHAATTPSLGAAASYVILSDTYTNTVGGSVINGDIGFTTGPAVVPGGTHANYGSGAPYATAVIDQGNALTALAAQPCTFTFAPGPIDLSTDITHGPVGVYTPGVYCSTGAMNIGGPLTLNGAGTYIFRPDGALTSTAGAVVTLTGASACDVFWTPTQAATLAANTTFFGTIISNAGVTVGANTAWTGRALAAGGTVTTDTNTMSAPTCAAPPVSSGNTLLAPIIHVVKVPTPLALPAGPGPVTYAYTVTNPGGIAMHDVTLVDDKCSNVVYLSGDANSDLLLDTNEAWSYTCSTNLTQTTVNFATARGVANDMSSVDTAIAQVNVGIPVIPPLINIIKTPSPSILPFGGSLVTYNYVVTNPGTVPLTNVTVSDDKCTNVTFVSGDVNSDSQLQSTETWRYTCSTNVVLTTTNTGIATGQANGLTAVDTALASVVVVGSPVPPPLIHIIKEAQPVILPATGGMVDYTYSVTNPGAITLNNVSVVDNRCGAVSYVSGDLNGNSLLEVNEEWVYTCRQNLTSSTVNTATAQGTGNGLTVTDVSIASVVLSPALIPPAPALPNTGVGTGVMSVGGMFAIFGAFLSAILLFAYTQWKRLF